MEIQVLQYSHRDGRVPFARWFADLDATAAAKVRTAITRLREGNWSNVKGVGGGVFEIKIDFGPGYRVYLGQDGPALVILLGGGTKPQQDRDIQLARERWRDYKQRKT